MNKIFFIFVILLTITAYSLDRENYNKNGLSSVNTNEINTNDTNTTVKATSPLVLGFRIVGSLLILSVMIFGVIYGIKKSGIVSGTSPKSKGSFELLETLPTGQNSMIMLVRFEQDILVLGQTVNNITTIKTIEGGEAAKIIFDKRGGETVSQFQKNLNGFIDGMKKDHEETV